MSPSPLSSSSAFLPASTPPRVGNPWALSKIVHSRVIRRYCRREIISLSNRTCAVYDKPQARSAGTWFPYIALADPRAEPPTHVSAYIVRSEYTFVGSICKDRAPHTLHSHCSPTFGGLSTLCDIPTRSIGLERDKTSFPMPLGKSDQTVKDRY